MRYFLTGRHPDVSRILLVESGSRRIVERVIPVLRRVYGDAVPVDLVSCFATLPEGFDAAATRVYRVGDYRGREGRRKLYRELALSNYGVMGIVCSNEPLMTKWKYAIGWKVPAKVFVINENGDFFWLDRTRHKQVRQFVLLRAGLAGAGAVRTLAGLVSFPFVLAYLLLYATVVHAQRALRRT